MAGIMRDRAYNDKLSSYARFPSSELTAIVSQIEAETGDPAIRESIHFSTGVLNRIERQLTLGCTMVTDARIIFAGLDEHVREKLPVTFKCFIDNPQVVTHAAIKHATRAEIAVELALALPGPKIMVVGSAPMAIRRMLQMHQRSPLCETTIIAAANGFANIVELKERVWESGLPCVVVRGRSGGANAAIAIANALLRHAASKQP